MKGRIFGVTMMIWAAGMASAQERPTLSGATENDWHVSVNGFLWQVPDACLMPRRLGDAESGRRLGDAEEGRNLGDAEQGRKLGDAEDGRRLGDAEDGRKLGDAEDGRRLGDAEDGRNLGDAADGRKLGDAEAGRMLGDAEGGRNLGDAEAGRRLGDLDVGPRCEHVSLDGVPNGILLYEVSPGTVELNPRNPYFLEVRPSPGGALIVLR
jgi:hypothetical protein